MERDQCGMGPYISGLDALLAKYLMVASVVQTLVSLCDFISVLI